MYYEHFGLSQAPFKITPDTRLFYEGGKRGDILEALAYAILSGEGIVKVVGEVGSGKTMLSRMLEVKLPDHVDIVYFANPSLAPADVLYAIAVELKIDLSAGTDRIQALHALQQTLLQRHAEGRQVVCFVEEAQSMPLETLEEIRLLSNLETHVAKLLQIVLFGQPELDENLDEQSIRQLKERIVHSFYLDPLEKTDISSYISFRMRAVGYRGPDVFTLGAYKALEKASLGLIRRVNIIGDKALLAAYAEDSHQVTEKHVRSAIRDSEFGRDPDRKYPYRWIYAAAAVLLAVVVGWLLGGGAANLGLTGSDPASQAVAPGEGRATPGGAQSEQAAAPVATARIQQSLQTQAPAAATGMPAYQTVAPAAPAVSQVVQAVAATTQVAASTAQPLAPAVQPAAPAAQVLAPAAQAVSPAVAPEAIVQSSLPAQQQPTAQPSFQGQAQAQALPTQGFVRQIAQPARLQPPGHAMAQQAIGRAAIWCAAIAGQEGVFRQGAGLKCGRRESQQVGDEGAPDKTAAEQPGGRSGEARMMVAHTGARTSIGKLVAREAQGIPKTRRTVSRWADS